jgi:DNA-binding NarL/FixJ family response regulator
MMNDYSIGLHLLGILHQAKIRTIVCTTLNDDLLMKLACVGTCAVVSHASMSELPYLVRDVHAIGEHLFNNLKQIRDNCRQLEIRRLIEKVGYTELYVMFLASKGKTQPQIAEYLDIELKKVQSCYKKAQRCLNVNSMDKACALVSYLEIRSSDLERWKDNYDKRFQNSAY